MHRFALGALVNVTVGKAFTVVVLDVAANAAQLPELV